MVNHSGLDFGRVKMVHIAFKVAFMVVFILFVCAILFVPIALMVTLEDKEGKEEESKPTIPPEESSPDTFFNLS